MDNPKGKVVYVCGTGGKTGYIFREAVRAAREGKSVFVTTTTHILREEGTVTDGAEALKKLAPGKVLVAGSPDPVNDRKIVGFPEDVYRAVRDRADLTLVEADGARHAQIKVPYPHEPVIGEDATEIVVIYGARAAGLSIREAAYNPEGVSSVTGKGLDEILTESDVETAGLCGSPSKALSRRAGAAGKRGGPHISHDSSCGRHEHALRLQQAALSD